MKKRLITSTLSVVMALSVMSTPVFAADVITTPSAPQQIAVGEVGSRTSIINRLEQAKKDLATVNAKIASEQAQLTTLTKQMGDLQAKLSLVSSQTASARQDVANKKVATDKARGNAAAIKESLDKVTKAYYSEPDVITVESKVAAKVVRTTKINTRKAELKKQMDSLTAQYNLAKSDVSVKEAAYNSAMKNLSVLESNRGYLEGQVQSLANRIKELKFMIAKDTNRAAELQKLIDTLNTQLQNYPSVPTPTTTSIK